jgi:hypothetical protein
MLGNVRLWELRSHHVDAVLRSALAKKRGTSTARHIRKVLSAVIEYARTLWMFSGDNPAQLVEIPEHVSVRRPRAMSAEQIRTWLNGATDRVPKGRNELRPLRTMSLLGIFCGLGVSEQALAACQPDTRSRLGGRGLHPAGKSRRDRALLSRPEWDAQDQASPEGGAIARYRAGRAE